MPHSLCKGVQYAIFAELVCVEELDGVEDAQSILKSINTTIFLGKN